MLKLWNKKRNSKKIKIIKYLFLKDYFHEKIVNIKSNHFFFFLQHLISTVSDSKPDTNPPKSSNSCSNKKSNQSSPKTESAKTVNSDQSGKSSTGNSKSPVYNSGSSYPCDTSGFGLTTPKPDYSDPSKSAYSDPIKSAYTESMKSVYADSSKPSYLSDSAKTSSDIYKAHYPFGIDSSVKQQSYMNFTPMNMAYIEAAKSAGYYFDPSASRSMYYPGFDPKTTGYHSDGSPTGMTNGGIGTDYSLSKSESGYLPRVSGKPDYMDMMSSGDPYYMSAAEQHHYQHQQQQQEQQDHNRIDCNGISLHAQHHHLTPVSEPSKLEYSGSMRSGHEPAMTSDGAAKSTEFLLPGQIKAEYPPTTQQHHLPQQNHQTHKHHQQLPMHPHSSPQPFSASSEAPTKESSSMSLISDSRQLAHHHHHHHHQQNNTLMTSSTYALSSLSVPSTAHDNSASHDVMAPSYRGSGLEGCPSSSANPASLRGASDGGAAAALHSVPVAS